MKIHHTYGSNPVFHVGLGYMCGVIRSFVKVFLLRDHLCGQLLCSSDDGWPKHRGLLLTHLLKHAGTLITNVHAGLIDIFFTES